MFTCSAKDYDKLCYLSADDTNSSVPDGALRATDVSCQADVVVCNYCVTNELPVIICRHTHNTSSHYLLQSAASLVPIKLQLLSNSLMIAITLGFE